MAPVPSVWRTFFAVLLACTGPSSQQVPSGFEYPAGLHSPPEVFFEGIGSRTQTILEYETPIQVYIARHLELSVWNCIARYHPSALDAVTHTDPTTRAPVEYHTSEARALCSVYAVNKLVPELLPTSADTVSEWLEELGLDASIMTDDDAKDAAMAGDATPRVLGSVVAAEMIEDMQTDGWNHLGTVRTVAMKKGKVRPAHPAEADTMCTANCRPFSDTTGYKPRNTPWAITVPSAWQPLTETDSNGFFYTQEHVTPHIGFTATPAILSKREVRSRKLRDRPDYDYDHETDLVIERVGNLDDYQKAVVELMDGKLALAGGLHVLLREQYGMSLEAQMYYSLGYSSSEFDAVILSWKEKVRHDLIRPTSTVRARGDEAISSFVNDGEPHAAYDWQPYIRVMPHSEYPSGSGCICTAIAQYVDAFVQDAFELESLVSRWPFPAGSSRVQPGIVPAEDIIATFNNMTELRDACGDSRLWGGMHFTASVSDSYELCDGLGSKGYEMMQGLLGNATFDSLMDGEIVTLYNPTTNATV